LARERGWLLGLRHVHPEALEHLGGPRQSNLVALILSVLVLGQKPFDLLLLFCREPVSLFALLKRQLGIGSSRPTLRQCVLLGVLQSALLVLSVLPLPLGEGEHMLRRPCERRGLRRGLEEAGERVDHRGWFQGMFGSV
jgi:hypothetical protein